jgi:HK97 gp10 family phage protein
MASTFVQIKGLHELGENMRRLAEDMNVKIARQATNAGAQVIKKLAIQKAPIAPPDITPKIPYGSLKKNIIVARIGKGRTTLTSLHIVAVRGGAKHNFASHVGSLQEFGTVRNVKPQPFMRPAFDEGKEAATSAIVDKLGKGIDAAVAALPK